MGIIPFLDEKNSSTRDKILAILASGSNLNTKLINNTLKNNYSVNITYQAVHKTLRQMREENVVKFDGKNYSIDEAWLKKIKLLVDRFNLSTERPFSQDINFDELVSSKESVKFAVKPGRNSTISITASGNTLLSPLPGYRLSRE